MTAGQQPTIRGTREAERTPFRISRAPTLWAATLFLSMAFGMTTAAVWIHDDRLRQLEASTALIAGQTARHLESWFDARLAVVDILTSARPVNYADDPLEFSRDAALLLERLPGLLALNWVDSEGVIRAVAPDAGNEAARYSNLFEHPEPDVARALTEAARSGAVTRTRTITLLQGGSGFAVYWPVVQTDGVVAGYLNGVVRAEELIASSGIADQLGPSYRLELRDLDGAVTWTNAPTSARPWRLVAEHGLPILGLDWQLSVAPAARTLSSAGALPQLGVIVAVGYLLAALLAALFWRRMLGERALQRRAQESRDLLDQLPHAVYLKDTEGRLTFANRALVQAWGRPPSALIGNTGASLPATEEDQVLAADADREVLMTGAGIPVREEMFTDESGKTRVFEVARVPYRNPRPGGPAMLGVAVDVTARHEGEAFRERVAIALDQAGEAITVLDHRGRIVFANPAFVRMMGFEGRDVTGLHISEFIAQGSEDKQLLAEIGDALGRGEVWKSRYVSSWEDGIDRVRDATVAPVRAEGRTAGYIGVLRDVTREVDLEEQLRQSQKLEAVGRLAGGVAHDFNNLLTVILGYTEVLRHDVELRDTAADVVLEIERAAERAASLTRQLLTFSRRRSTRAVSAELSEVVRGLIPMLERLIGEDVTIELELDERAGRVGADTEELEQIIVNLCVNARDALTEGGRIVVSTAIREAVGAPGLRPRLDGGAYAVLSVTDNGCGMALDVQEHVFEPFFTTKSVGLGTGLGLSMVYGIAEQRGGAVQVESLAGRGTTLSVWLPVLADSTEAEPLPEPQAAAATAPGSGFTVLLAEDESGIRKLMTKSLERAGYRVVAAADGIEALEQAAALDTIDLLLTDVVMPRMGGPELRQRLQALRPGLQTLFVSGYAPDSPRSARLATDDVLLQKPFRPQALLEAVAARLETPAPAALQQRSNSAPTRGG